MIDAKSMAYPLLKASEDHTNEGGECKTIKIGEQEIHCCLDKDGKIINPILRAYARSTRQ